MSDLLGTVLPLAVVVGLSPLPILPAVMLLMTPGAGRNGRAFLAAWVVGLTLVVGLAVALGGLADPDQATEQGVDWIQVVTGVVFLAMAAVKLWKGRGPATSEPPAWMAALDSYTPRQSARLGALLATVNPKNLAMALAAGAEIVLLADGSGQVVAGVVGFVLVGSAGVGMPIMADLLLGRRVAPALRAARSWLERHGSALSVGVLLVLGVLMLLGGISGAL